MRLRDIQQVLTNTIGELEIRVVSIDGSKDKEIHEPKRTLEAIEALEPTGLFQAEITSLLSVSVIVNNVSDPIVVPLPAYQGFHNTLTSLRQRAGVFLGVLNEFIGEQDRYSIGVQLPPGLDLQQAAEVISDLNKILEQTLLNPDTDGTITLQGFDRGSEWLEVGLGSVVALTFFSRMVQSYLHIKAKGIEIEAQREQVKSMQLDNAMKEKINDSLTQQLETYQKQEQDDLLGEDYDQNGRIKLGLDLLTKWMDRGLQILPSLSAPEDIKPAFFPPKQPKQIEQTKQIASQQEKEPDQNGGE